MRYSPARRDFEQLKDLMYQVPQQFGRGAVVLEVVSGHEDDCECERCSMADEPDARSATSGPATPDQAEDLAEELNEDAQRSAEQAEQLKGIAAALRSVGD